MALSDVVGLVLKSFCCISELVPEKALANLSGKKKKVSSV